MEATISTPTQACLLKSAQQPQLGLGRLPRLKCSSPRIKAINNQAFSSEYREPCRNRKIWIKSEKEIEPIYISGHSHRNPFEGVAEKARWAALLLYKALLLLGVGLGATAPAMAKSSPPPASEVLVQKAVEQATHKTAEKSAQSGSQNESAEKKNNVTEKDAQVGTKNGVAPLLGEEFWKDMDLCKGSITTILKNILDGDPTNHDALECLAKTLVDNDDPARALYVIEKLELLEPREMEWKYLKGVAYDMNGQFQLAKNIFEDILKIEPFSSKAIQGLMMAMDELGESDSVVEVVEEAMVKAREEKNVTEARNIGMLIGQYFMMKGLLYEALGHYQEMLEEDSEDFRPYLCQGIIYSALGEKAKAEKQFKIYEKLCPKDYPDRKYLDALMLKAKEEGQKRFELKQKDKYVKIFPFGKGNQKQSSDK